MYLLVPELRVAGVIKAGDTPDELPVHPRVAQFTLRVHLEYPTSLKCIQFDRKGAGSLH